jgi:hypothetical protein
MSATLYAVPSVPVRFRHPLLVRLLVRLPGLPALPRTAVPAVLRLGLPLEVSVNRRTIGGNGRVRLPSLVHAARNVPRRRAADPHGPSGVRQLGTRQTPVVCRRQQEGYPPPSHNTRRTDILTTFSQNTARPQLLPARPLQAPPPVDPPHPPPRPRPAPPASLRPRPAPPAPRSTPPNVLKCAFEHAIAGSNAHMSTPANGPECAIEPVPAEPVPAPLVSSRRAAGRGRGRRSASCRPGPARQCRGTSRRNRGPAAAGAERTRSNGCRAG